jgi:hypothetical protein
VLPRKIATQPVFSLYQTWGRNVAYASGKYSYGLCDYCGQRYPYNVLRKNWKGYKVCPADYEPKEPQLEPLRFVADAQALDQPRPDRSEPLDVYVGAPGDSLFQSVGSATGTNDMRPSRVDNALVLQLQLGQVTVMTT